MKKDERDALAKRIIEFYLNVANRSTKLTWHHFKVEKVSKTTCYRIIRRYEATNQTVTRSPPGRPAAIMDESTVSSVARLLARNPCISEAELARRLKLAVSTVGYIKRLKLDLRSRKKVRAPMYTKDQERRAIRNCRKLAQKLDKHKRWIIIIDDETYVPSDPTQIPGQQFYSSGPDFDPPLECKIAPKTKFPAKYLVWQAIDEYGQVTSPYVTKGSLNGKKYRDECLKKRLLPFIRKKHKNSTIFLWMDMASCHYSNIVLTWLRANKIKYVERYDNAPNVPQARPIEKFWALCKAEYKKYPDPAKNVSEFGRRWRKISSKVAKDHGQNLMANIRERIASIGYKGVYSYLNTN